MTYFDFLIGGFVFAGHFAAVAACGHFADVMDGRGHRRTALVLGVGGIIIFAMSLVGMIFAHPWTSYTHPGHDAPPACVDRSTP